MEPKITLQAYNYNYLTEIVSGSGSVDSTRAALLRANLKVCILSAMHPKAKGNTDVFTACMRAGTSEERARACDVFNLCPLSRLEDPLILNHVESTVSRRSVKSALPIPLVESEPEPSAGQDPYLVEVLSDSEPDLPEPSDDELRTDQELLELETAASGPSYIPPRLPVTQDIPEGLRDKWRARSISIHNRINETPAPERLRRRIRSNWSVLLQSALGIAEKVVAKADFDIDADENLLPFAELIGNEALTARSERASRR
jgi:hypothetical protein